MYVMKIQTANMKFSNESKKEKDRAKTNGKELYRTENVC